MNSSPPSNHGQAPGPAGSFAEFYPFYLSQHSDRTCRRLHFVGSLLFLLIVGLSVVHGIAGGLILAIVTAYGFAWVGHFVFEKNRPATFKHPIYSFMGDWVMFKDMLMGRIPF